MRLLRAGRLAATGVALTLLAGACSSDGKTSASPDANASASRSPEDVQAPPAKVDAGLKQIEDVTGQLAAAAGSDKAHAEDLSHRIEPVWQEIEGAVKANDADAYITFEDSFAALGKAAETGDTAKAQEASRTVAAIVTAYLAKYPG